MSRFYRFAKANGNLVVRDTERGEDYAFLMLKTDTPEALSESVVTHILEAEAEGHDAGYIPRPVNAGGQLLIAVTERMSAGPADE